jgi:hypothetical protein
MVDAFWLIALGIWVLYLGFALLNKNGIWGALCLFAFLSPLIPIQVGGNISGEAPFLSIHRVLLSVVFLLWFLQTSLSKDPIRVPYRIAILALALLLGLSTLFSLDVGASAKNIVRWLVELLGLYVLTFNLAQNRVSVVTLLHGMVASGFLVAVLAVIQAFTGFNPYNLISASREGMFSFGAAFRFESLRLITVSFSNHIQLGGYLVLLLPYVVFLIRYTKHQLFLKTGFVFMVFAAILTTSRGAWAGAGVALAIVSLKTKEWKWLCLVGLLLLVFLIQPFVAQDIRTQILILTSPDLYSPEVLQRTPGIRVALYQLIILSSLQGSVRQALFGTGLHTYANFPITGLLQGKNYSFSDGATLLKLYREMGILAFTCLIGLLTAVLVNLWRNTHVDEDQWRRDLGRAVVASVIGFLVVSLLSMDIISYPVTGELFWIALGIGTWLSMSAEKQ